MGSADEPEVTRALPPTEAFALLGQEIRMGVLEALFEADRERLPFSAIADAVGLRDPGHLHYHLEELRPHFVERTESGYRLARPGYTAIRAIRAGALTDRGELGPVALDGDCVLCGGDRELRYRDGFGVVVCPDCRSWFVRYPFPPGGLVDREPAAIPDVLDARCRSIRRLGNAGVCDRCGGAMDRRLVPGSPAPFGHPANVRYRCHRCDCRFDSTVGAALVGHPAVVGALRKRGIDAREPHLWDLAFAYDAERLTVVDRDPVAVELTVPADGGAVVLTVGDDGGVRGTRSAGAGSG